MDQNARDVWFQKQAEIYAKFDAGMQLIQQEGMRPDPLLTEKKGGYAIVLKPRKFITKSLAVFAEFVHKETQGGVFPYEATTMHTAFSDFKVDSGYVPEQDPQHNHTLETLVQVADKVRRNVKGLVVCTYEQGVVFNQTTGILKGTPQEKFLMYAHELVSVGNEHGISLRMPWGAHITFARTVRELSSENGKAIASFCGEVPDDSPSRYLSIQIGWFTCSTEEGYNIRVVEELPLFDE